MRYEQKWDFNFRYRPKVDSPDAILIKYLQSYKPSERLSFNLESSPCFYLVAAYGEFGDLDDLEQLETFVCQLRETYGKDYNDVHDLSLNINLTQDRKLQIGVNTMDTLSQLLCLPSFLRLVG